MQVNFTVERLKCNTVERIFGVGWLQNEREIVSTFSVLGGYRMNENFKSEVLLLIVVNKAS